MLRVLTKTTTGNNTMETEKKQTPQDIANLLHTKKMDADPWGGKRSPIDGFGAYLKTLENDKTPREILEAIHSEQTIPPLYVEKENQSQNITVQDAVDTIKNLNAITGKEFYFKAHKGGIILCEE